MTGFGGMLSFDIRGGKEAAFRFIEALHILPLPNRWGVSSRWSSIPKP
jgi:cystathionine beta-lyase/cystathionine gamma-synthase